MLERKRFPANAVFFSYLRFSTAKQSDGDSRRRQVEVRDSFLDRIGEKLCEGGVFLDAGVSGFRGAHRGDRNELGRFLSLVKKGLIPEGAYLIIESFDRLSREEILPALSLVVEIVNAGVGIVQLSPVEEIYDKATNPFLFVLLIVELMRANSESKVKSERIAKAWEQRRRESAATGRPLTGRTPGWIEVVGGECRLIPKKAAAVRRLFELVAGGHGIVRAHKQLRAEGLESPGRSPKWSLGYSGRILGSELAIGYCQTTKDGEKAERLRIYPAAVSEDLYYAARAGLASREDGGNRGRSDNGVNLFESLLFSAAAPTEGFQWKWVRDRRNPNRVVEYPRYVNNGSIQSGDGVVSFRADIFEQAVLTQLQELRAADVFPQAAKVADDGIAPLEQKLTAVRERLRQIEDRMATDGDLDSLTRVAKRLSEDEKKLAAELLSKRTAAAFSAKDALSQTQTLWAALAAAEDRESARLTLRHAIQRLVAGVWGLVVKDGSRRAVLSQIHFRDSDFVRTVLFYFRPELARKAGPNVPMFWRLEGPSRRLPTDGVDIRIAAHRRCVEKVLSLQIADSAWHREIESTRPSVAEQHRSRRKRSYWKQKPSRQSEPPESESTPRGGRE